MSAPRPFIKTLTTTPADPPANLPPPDFRRSENPARTGLLRKVPYLCAFMAQGKCCAAIRQRMRYLLAGPAPSLISRPARASYGDYPDA